MYYIHRGISLNRHFFLPSPFSNMFFLVQSNGTFSLFFILFLIGLYRSGCFVFLPIWNKYNSIKYNDRGFWTEKNQQPCTNPLWWEMFLFPLIAWTVYCSRVQKCTSCVFWNVRVIIMIIMDCIKVYIKRKCVWYPWLSVPASVCSCVEHLCSN